MLTGQDIHEQWAMHHLHAKHWDDVSPLAKRLYESLAQTLNHETCSIIAVKCLTCNEMVDVYEYTGHVCTSSGVLTNISASASQVN
jgi:benzoyl-CoA reductase/2-hydroxyglutaryl-CoA dehydratase subunit BcrC/BadD/HgdB